MKNKQFTFGALLSYGTIAFNIISGLLFTPWMITTLGNDQYALYTLAVSVINIFLMDFGIGSAVTKFLSNFYARKQYDEANRFMGIVYKVFIAISVIIMIVLAIFYCFIDSIYVKLTLDELRVFKHLFIIVAAYSVLSFPLTPYNGILTSNERFIELKLCGFMQKFSNVLLTLVFLLLRCGVYALVLIHAFTNFFFLLVKYFFIRKKTKQRADLNSWDGKIAKKLFNYSIWTTIMSLAQRCIFNIMPTIIAATIGSAEVTLFSLASTLEGYVYTFSSAINGMLMPKISRIVKNENTDEQLTQLMTRVGRYHICTIGLLYLGFICVGREFVNLWLGTGYEPVYWSALLLIFPSLLSTPQQVASCALLLKDIVKEQALVYTGMAVCSVVLSLLLIPRIGILGASLSICCAYLLSFTCKNILYRRKLFVSLHKYFRQTYGKWIVVVACTSIFYWVLSAVVPFSGWLGLLLHAGMIAACYLTLYGFVCLSKEERIGLLYRIKKG